MNSERKEVRLPQAAEELLAAWPEPERPDIFWEQLASTIDARVQITSLGSTAGDLLAAPLPAAAEEGPYANERRSGPMVKPRPSEAPARSLAELARASIAAAAREKEDRHAATRQSLSIATQGRADAPRVAEELRRRNTPIPEPARESQPSQAPTAAGARSRGRAWGAGAAVLGIAAGIAFFASGPSTDAPASAQVAAPLPQVPSQPTPAPAAPEAPANSDANGAIALEDIRPERQASPATGTAAQGAPRAAAAKPSRAVAAAGPAGAAPAAAPKDDLPPVPGMRSAHDVGLSAKPSTGAVMAAVGAVMGGARACVAGQSGPSEATVTFGSDGRVKTVQVSGPAAGTPAEACIRSALSGARVQQFGAESFSVAVPIRP